MKWVKRYKKQLLGFVIGSLVGGICVWGYFVIMHNQTALGYQGKGVTISWLPRTITRFAPIIEAQAKRYNIDANFVAIIMTLESGGYTKADSGQASGLMQITPYTATDIATKHLLKPVKKYDVWHPETNIEFGVAYLVHLRDTFCDYKDGPSWNACAELIAAGYNGGPGAANQLFLGNGLGDTQTVIYSRNAFNMWREKRAKTSPTYQRWLDAGGQSLVDEATHEMK